MTTEELLRTLPRPIALVGNGIARRRLGHVIDGYRTVIRLNNYQTTAFESYVGTRTDFRCVTGWYDVRNRNEHPEFSPFTASAAESFALPTYDRNNSSPVITAQRDVHERFPGVSTPSPGLALVQLLTELGIAVDVFHFDDPAELRALGDSVTAVEKLPDVEAGPRREPSPRSAPGRWPACDVDFRKPGPAYAR